MFRFKKSLPRGCGNRPSAAARLHLETLEDRWMPTVTAPIMTATAVSATQVNLGWNSVAGATGYLVDEWINGTWQQIANFTNPNCTVTGLSPNRTYYFDVGAYDWSGTSWANFQSATTLVAAPSFTLTAASTTQVNMKWDSVAGATGYSVEEWVSGAWKIIGNFGSTTTACYVPGLTANTKYYFNVGAYNTLGTTWANYQSVTTAAATTTFDHPAAGMAYAPVSGALFGPNGPSYLDVHQGEVGDCWLLSSLAATAAQAPQDIRNMFTYQGTAVENGYTVGVYTVRLFDTYGTARYITVDTELPGGGTEYDRPANGVLWVALAEKAYVQANGAGWVNTQHVAWDSYSALDIGSPQWALHAITGNSGAGYYMNPANMAAAWNAGEIVVLTSSSNPASPYIVGDAAVQHCYALVGYNPASSMPFLVYNPWGTDSTGWALLYYNGHQVYGVFNATGTFLTQNFFAYSIVYGAEGSPASTLAKVSWDFATAPSHLPEVLQAASTARAMSSAEDACLAEASVPSQPAFVTQPRSRLSNVDAVYADTGDWDLSADLLWLPLASAKG
jgi:hypothetical protein